MTDPPVGSWFSVRCVLRFAATEGAAATYEERITLWRTEGFARAVDLAEADAHRYADDTGAEYVGLAQAFELGEFPDHGAEVFSLMRDSELAVNDYLDAFYDTGRERQRDLDDAGPQRQRDPDDTGPQH